MYQAHVRGFKMEWVEVFLENFLVRFAFEVEACIGGIDEVLREQHEVAEVM